MSLGQGSNEASEKEREKLHDNDDGLKGGECVCAAFEIMR